MFCFRFKIAPEKKNRNVKKSPFLWMSALPSKRHFKSIGYVLIILDEGKAITFCEKGNAM